MSGLLGFDDEGFDPYDDEGFASVAPEGLDEPKKSSLCLGHDDVEKSLLGFINSGSMPHALILSGQQGIGKSTMAFRLARYLLQKGLPNSAQDNLFGDEPEDAISLDVSSDSGVFSKVASGGHPDFLYIERPVDERKGKRKNTVDVATARKVAPFLRMTASDGGWRVVIIDDADTMNRNAQNALLKILEEPPSNTLLILVTHRIGALIPTIKSRCRVLNVQPLSGETLEALLLKSCGSELSTNDKNLLMSFAPGSIGICQDIIEQNGLETISEVISMLEADTLHWSLVHHLADRVGRVGQEQAFKHVERALCSVVSLMVSAKARGQLTVDVAPNFSAKYFGGKSLDLFINLYDELKDHFEQTHRGNLDKRQSILSAFQCVENFISA